MKQTATEPKPRKPQPPTWYFPRYVAEHKKGFDALMFRSPRVVNDVPIVSHGKSWKPQLNVADFLYRLYLIFSCGGRGYLISSYVSKFYPLITPKLLTDHTIHKKRPRAAAAGSMHLEAPPPLRLQQWRYPESRDRIPDLAMVEQARI